MPNPSKDELKELLDEVIENVLESLGYSNQTFAPTGNKEQNKGKLAQMWEDIGQEFGTKLADLLEGGTEDVSEWMSDLFGALGDLGAKHEEAQMEMVTWAFLTQYAEDNDLDSTWLYGDTFCETVFGVLGSSEWEKEILADCKSNYQPDANDKVDEAYDDFWSGEYGTGA